MRPRISALLVALLLASGASFWFDVQAGESTPEPAVWRVQIVGRSATSEGTCFLVHRDTQAKGTVLYFLTSARLFKASEADRRAGARQIRIFSGHHAPIDVAPNSVVLPMGDMLDVAVIRVVAPAATIVPFPVVFEPPEVGGAFLISGYQVDGSLATVTERVGFWATRQILGDRDASNIIGCAGAPAMSDRGVFGIVSQCEVHRPPSITPLSVARSFISRNVPGWAHTQ